MHDEPEVPRFQLAGHLSKAGVGDLEQAWRTASSVIRGRCFLCDLSQVTSIDPSGEELLNKWSAQGGRLVAVSQQARVRLQVMTDRKVSLLETPRESESPNG